MGGTTFRYSVEKIVKIEELYNAAIKALKVVHAGVRNMISKADYQRLKANANLRVVA